MGGSGNERGSGEVVGVRSHAPLRISWLGWAGAQRGEGEREESEFVAALRWEAVGLPRVRVCVCGCMGCRHTDALGVATARQKMAGFGSYQLVFLAPLPLPSTFPESQSLTLHAGTSLLSFFLSLFFLSTLYNILRRSSCLSMNQG
jgi:hypothetical protein